MKTQFEIRSDKFPPYDDEEDIINPDLWGKRLAEYVVINLPNHNFQTEELIPEDWGWCIPIANDEFNLWIGCGHQYGAPDTFLCFIEPSKPVIRKSLKKVDTTNTVDGLAKALESIFTSDPEIKDFRWLEENEI